MVVVGVLEPGIGHKGARLGLASGPRVGLGSEIIAELQEETLRL